MPALGASKYPLEQDASIHAPKHSLAVLKHCFPTAFGEIQHNDKYKKKRILSGQLLCTDHAVRIYQILAL